MAKKSNKQAKKSFKKAFKYYEDGKLEEALQYFNETISQDSEFVEAFYARGLIKEYFEDYKNALVDYSRVIQLDPTHKKALKHQKKMRDPCRLS